MRKHLPAFRSITICWVVVIALGVTRAHASPNKVCLCHIPPGDPGNAHTTCVGKPAVRAHLRHGDTLGACPVTCGGSGGATCPDGQFCKPNEGTCAPDATGSCANIPVGCPATLAPVCGCDGTTYSNACYADVARVPVQHAGACETEVACSGSGEGICNAGQFCKPPQGQCTPGGPGACAPRPQTCPDVFDPVCGCDTTTFLNACFADQSRVGVSHTGFCEPRTACGGSEDATCAAGQFCKPPVGDCTPGAPGACVPNPPSCETIFKAVCGCDGKTYQNACAADAAAVGVSHTGPCAAPCEGADQADCGSGEVCRRPDGDCAQQAEGVCEAAPETCPAILAPACGCDGITYSNACIADARGVTIASRGPCVPPQLCGGIQGTSCGEHQFCKFLDGSCLWIDNQGICLSVPVLCPVDLNEVCGCDGITYRNSCYADAAHVIVSHKGACQTLQ